MTLEQAFIVLLGLACGVLGWFGRELYAAVNKLKDDIRLLEVRIGTDYVRYDRLQDALRPVMETLNEIKRTLEHKVDKQGPKP